MTGWLPTDPDVVEQALRMTYGPRRLPYAPTLCARCGATRPGPGDACDPRVPCTFREALAVAQRLGMLYVGDPRGMAFGRRVSESIVVPPDVCPACVERVLTGAA